MRTICVVGAGIVGLWSALDLRRRGMRVILVDQAAPGHGCSWGNAGWIVPSMSGPLPAPGVVTQSLRWMLAPDSPLHIKLGFDLDLLRWLWAFWRHCNDRDYVAGRQAVARLHQGVMESFDALEGEYIPFEMHRSGLLFAFLTAAYLREYREELQSLMTLGCGPVHELSASEIRTEEPALNGAVVGGLLVECARHVRPESLVTGLAVHLKTLGVEVRTGVRVTGFTRKGRRIQTARTSMEPIHADAFLITAGVRAGQLLSQTGCHIPLQAGKGYSITVDAPAHLLRRPVYLSEARVACSPFRGALRFGGTMELSGANGSLDDRRLKAMERGIRRFLPEVSTRGARTEWMGMRPVTPDGLPVIGRVPGIANLFVATGHAMLGVSLAGPTARLVGDVIAGGRPDPILAPFDPSRFMRRASLRSR